MRKFTMSRRTLMKTSAAAGVVLATPTILTSKGWAASYRNEPMGGTVTLGFNVPQSGAYADEGADELRAYQLAVEHINGEGDGGMLSTFSSKALKGNGVNGKKVVFVTGDTQTKSDAARASAKRMIEKDGAIMITGGASSSGVAIAVQGLRQDMGVIFMAGLTHSNDTTGKDRRANGFRHFFDTEMSGAALGPVLNKAYGSDRVAYHLTADYTWGWSQEGSIKKYTEKYGWKTVAAVRTPLGAGDFSQYIAPVLNSGADVLILNHYGRDMVNSLTQAVQFGLRDKMVNGKKFVIVVPLYSRLMAQGAGANIKGIFGSTNWHFREVLRPEVRLPAEPGGPYRLLPDDSVCRRRPAGGHVPSLRDRQGSGGLQVRRPRQRADRVPGRRSPMLQGCAGWEGQGEPDLQVRPAGDSRDHASGASRVSARHAWWRVGPV